MYQDLLIAVPALQAFARISEFLWGLRESGQCPRIEGFKQRCLAELLTEPWTGCTEELSRQSLTALAAGLACGAIEGAAYFGWAQAPAPWPPDGRLEVTCARLDEAWVVARERWPEAHVDDLQLQAAYGKHLNRETAQENIDFLAAPSRTEADFRRALLETYRTGYSLGLIDSAIVFLGGQVPDRL